jgi:hypothetical protein
MTVLELIRELEAVVSGTQDDVTLEVCVLKDDRRPTEFWVIDSVQLKKDPADGTPVVVIIPE